MSEEPEAKPNPMEGLLCTECGHVTDSSGWCPCQEGR